MSTRIYIEIVDGGFIIETMVDSLPRNKRVHLEAEKCADDVRARLRAYEATTKRTEVKPC